MSKYFVTGANGFIGSRLVAALVERGHAVRALSRRPDLTPQPPPGFDWPSGGPLASPLVEWVRGDITDRESLRRAMAGATHVFHLAAYAKNWARDRDVFWKMNVEGARNVFDAAEQLGVERVVWTSSMLTFGPTRPGEVGDEESPPPAGYFTDYERTKAVAERQAIERARGGFPLVIVHPGRVYGPGYLTEGNSVTLLIDQYDRGKMPFLLNFGVNVGNWVYVEDVVEGLLLAMEKGRVGERYLLGGENVSLREFFRLIDQTSGRRHFQIPLWKFWPMVVAWTLKKRADWLGIYPPITPGWVRLFSVDCAYSSEKARRELGYRITPLAEGLRRTYEWLERVRKEQG